MQTQEKSNASQRPFGWRDKVSYMMGDVACNLVMLMASSYLIIFSTKILGIAAGIISTLFMCARFVDAVTDVTVGRLSDMHTDRHGDHYRPWILYGALPLAISSCLMFNYFIADASMTFKIIWVGATYLIFCSGCYTAVNIPYGAMSNVISGEVKDRVSLSTWRNVGANVGSMILGVVIPLVVYVKDENGNDVADGRRFLTVAACLAVGALICLFICWKGSTERIHTTKKQVGGNENSAQIILQCLTNKTLLMKFGNAVFVYAVMILIATFNQYIFLDYYGNTSLSSLASIVQFVGLTITAPVATTLTSKYGKKELSVFGLAVSTAAYAIMFLTRVENPYLYLVGMFFVNLGLGITYMVSYSIVNDCVDAFYLDTGIKAAGTVYSVDSFVRKIAGAIAIGAGGWGLSLIGYDELATVQTETVRQSVFDITVGLPAVCLVIALLFMIKFPLNKKRVEENTAKLAAMQQS